MGPAPSPAAAGGECSYLAQTHLLPARTILPARGGDLCHRQVSQPLHGPQHLSDMEVCYCGCLQTTERVGPLRESGSGGAGAEVPLLGCSCGGERNAPSLGGSNCETHVWRWEGRFSSPQEQRAHLTQAVGTRCRQWASWEGPRSAWGRQGEG